MSGSMDWLELLKAFGSLAGSAAGGMGGATGTSGVGLPDASAATGATTSGLGMGGAGLPGGGVVEPASNMVVPQLNTDAMLPGPSTFQPPLPVPPVPPTAARPGGPSLPVPPAATPPPSTPSAVANLPQLDTDQIMPGDKTDGFGRSWFRRNIGDPWDKAWTEDPKTGLSPGMKALSGVSSMAGKLGASSGSSPAPAISGGGGGGGGSPIHPGKIDASQMALAREQARQMLMQRATLSAPWLKRPLVGGLMG